MPKPPRGPLAAVPYAEVAAQYSYEPETGVFRHKLTRGGAKAGDVAGGPAKNGYYYVSVRRHRTRAHLVAWLLMTGEWPARLVDHEDGDGLNNRWVNLRLGNKSLNGANMAMRKSNRSGFKGVKRDKKRWSARIMVNYIQHHLGNFDSPEEAHAAYVAAAKLHFGEFARAA